MRTMRSWVRRVLSAALLLAPLPVAAEAPVLSGFAPSAAEIPANTLRFYLIFSQPMARGQVRDAIRLLRADGSIVESPFLNLGVELWDPAQRRLTLIIDPGRIKQGVGPNVQAGAPLENGKRYILIVARSMTSATGHAIGSDQRVPIQVGPAEQRAVDPALWKISAPQAGSRDPLQVRFDRSMDDAASVRLIRVFGPDGAMVRGKVATKARDWSLIPEASWAPGAYRLVIAPTLEDVAGNTIRSAFDAEAGTIGKAAEPQEILFRVQGPDSE